MPSEGDMELIEQDGGVLLLNPVFYGGESMGPHLQIVDIVVKEGKAEVKSVVSRARIKLKPDGKIELKKGDE
jgi:hypothetical protein